MKIVVVGSGIAGLTAALEASKRHEVTLITKAELAESNTRYAQGGIAAVMFDDDSVENHIADTIAAGAGLCNPEAVRVLCEEGPERVRDLIQRGVEFDRANGEFARGLEAAHSHARVLHAGGDATGAAVELALVAAVRAAGIRVLEHHFLADLVLADSSGRSVGNSGQSPVSRFCSRVSGVSVITASGEVLNFRADAVILASGGAGQLYRHTTNPMVATGDGAAAAIRAGAVMADVEFYQFHPTSLAIPGNFLISEAVRGEGAVLRAADGTRFLADVHPLAELAPRDVVARGIAAQMEKQPGQPVLLDATALGAEFLCERFPSISRACAANGLDWARVPIPVTPAAHYWMGGIRTDLWGRTSVPGLFAVGEVAATGVHGANRLASNSLLESLVFASRAARALDGGPGVAGGECGEGVSGGETRPNASWPSEPWHEGVRPAANPATIPATTSEIQDNPPASDFSLDALQRLMWSRVGLLRSRKGLEEAASVLASWRGSVATIADREASNLLAVARVITAAALAREESVGAHFRTDCPEIPTQPAQNRPAQNQPAQNHPTEINPAVNPRAQSALATPHRPSPRKEPAISC